MYNQQLISQIQSSLQQMQSSEQSNAAQLRQITNELQQLFQRESSSIQQIQNLNQLCIQLSQEVQRVSQLGIQQQPWQSQVGGTFIQPSTPHSTVYPQQ